MKVKVTVCQLRNKPEALAEDWEALVAHVQAQGSDLVLFPEMAFSPWLAWDRKVNLVRWDTAVAHHDEWQIRFHELAPALLLGSRPVNRGRQRFNEGFVWDEINSYRTAHTKVYLPDETNFWEASWYHRGGGDFSPIQSGPFKIGFMICTDLWFMQHARAYGQAGVHIIANPRATEDVTADKWLAGGRANAVIAGAYGLSSNLVTDGRPQANMGGQGWIISPDGDVLGLTSRTEPFITQTIDLAVADAAKETYPRYVNGM